MQVALVMVDILFGIVWHLISFGEIICTCSSIRDCTRRSREQDNLQHCTLLLSELSQCLHSIGRITNHL